MAAEPEFLPLRHSGTVRDIKAISVSRGGNHDAPPVPRSAQSSQEARLTETGTGCWFVRSRFPAPNRPRKPGPGTGSTIEQPKKYILTCSAGYMRPSRQVRPMQWRLLRQDLLSRAWVSQFKPSCIYHGALLIGKVSPLKTGVARTGTPRNSASEPLA